MRSRIARPLAMLSVLGLLLMVLAAAAPTAAQTGSDCKLSVKPKQGGPGTEFVFSGKGYSPTHIDLKKSGGPTKTVQVAPDDPSRFTVRLVAGPDDTGTWKATAVEPGGCTASASFTVELPPTATVDAADDGMRGVALAGFAALGGLFVLASVVVLPRVSRTTRSR